MSASFRASRALCAAALLCLAPAIARAASSSPTPSPTPLRTIAHVVTADRMPETLNNSARAIYVVTHDQIERRGYRTVGAAIADVPGVQLARYGAIGATVSFGIRGSSSAETLVLINGMPAPGTLGDSVDLGALSTFDVKRIEIVEGGGSTLYGSGAIGGIINVITDTAREPNFASLRVGSFGDREVRAQGDGFSFERILANNDYSLPPSIVGGVPMPTTRANADYEATTLAYDAQRKFGAYTLAFHLGTQADHLGAPGPIPYFSATSREDDVNQEANLTFGRRTHQAMTTLQLGADRQIIAFGCSTGDPNCFQLAQSIDTEGRVSLGLRNVVGDARQRLIYGIDLSRGVVRGDSGGSGIAVNALAQAALYAQDIFTIGTRTHAYVGMRGERSGSLGGATSPSLGFTSEIGTGLFLKANYATAFRAPNASELYFPGYGYSALKPERARVGDLSFTDDRMLGAVTLGWFTNRTNDLIVPELVLPPFTYQPRNVDQAFMQGFTFTAKTRPLNGFVASVNATDLYIAQDLTTGTRLAYNPPVMNVGLRLSYRPLHTRSFEGFGVSIDTVGARGSVDPTQPLFDQPATYSTLDAYARWHLGKRATLSLRGYNLGNEPVAQIAGYPMPGRSFALELTTR